jgi:primosomal protein N'
LIAPPYYHAREVAIIPGRARTLQGRFGLRDPFVGNQSPGDAGRLWLCRNEASDQRESAALITRIIDLTTASNISTFKSNKSRRPYFENQRETRKHEQIFLLINRRGYWTNIMCANCGHMFVCPSCGGNLTYHQEDEMLKCHHCGYVENFPKVCPECGTTTLMRTGYGTERVVKELQDLPRPGFAGSIPMWGKSQKRRENHP